MSNAIGLRFYKVTFHQERSSSTICIDDPILQHGSSHILTESLTKHTSVTNVDSAQRGWFFDKPNSIDQRNITGRITYGIHGIVSRFVGITDRKEKFKRSASDLEEIPLYYQFFRPKGAHYSIFIFQSFGVRSCVKLVQQAFQDFVKSKTGLIVRFKKLLPTEVGINLFGDALVKEMTLFKQKVSSDKVNAYRDDAPGEYDIKLSLTAKGKSNFGFYRNINADKLKATGRSVAAIDDFDKATVKVRIGNNSKHITVFGNQGEAGTIDITDDSDLVMENGHPTVESLEKVSKPILKQFNGALIGYKK